MLTFIVNRVIFFRFFYSLLLFVPTKICEFFCRMLPFLPKAFLQLPISAIPRVNLFLAMKQYSIIELMHYIKGNKVTLKSEDVLLQLMSEFFKIKENLYHLINQQPHNHFNSKQIFAICRALPKSFERNRNRYNQLLLCQELYQLVDYFLPNITNAKRKQMKQGPKRKSYEVLLTWKQFAEILTNRIRASLSGNLQEMANHKEHFKLFYLINQLEFLSKEIQGWAKRQEKTPRKRLHQSIEFIYPESGTNRKTLATTAIDSRNASKYQKSETIEEFHQKANEYCLLRANTAKLERKPAKMSVRCPSAASLLKHETYKQPLFESKKPILKYKRKSADFEPKSHRNFELSENNPCFDTNPNSRMRQIKLTVSKERKVSILNKSPKEDDDGLRIKSRQYLIDNDKLRKSGIGKLNKRKKDVKPNVVSNEQIVTSKEMESEEKLEDSQCQILDPENFVEVRESVPTKTSIKRQSMITSKKKMEYQSQKSLFSSACWDNQENTLYIKSRHLYKKARRSGRASVRKSQELIVSSTGNPMKSKESKFNKRRKAIRSSHNMEMTEIQNLVKQEQQLQEKKKLQFNQNVLLAFSDALKSRTNLKSKKQLQKDTEIIEKKTMNELFQQMNTFLKDFYTGKPTKASQSVFFQQQKRLRTSQDHNFREKMKELIQSNGNANIFEISSTQVNNKDQIYNQIHRYLSFNSDTDWIRHMYMPKQHLAQKSF